MKFPKSTPSETLRAPSYQLLTPHQPYYFSARRSDSHGAMRLHLAFKSSHKGDFLFIDGSFGEHGPQFTVRNPEGDSHGSLELAVGAMYELGQWGLKQIGTAAPALKNLVAPTQSAWVSGRHLRMSVVNLKGELTLSVTDVGSSNGTAVREEAIYPGSRTSTIDIEKVRGDTSRRLQGTQDVGLSHPTQVTRLSAADQAALQAAHARNQQTVQVPTGGVAAPVLQHTPQSQPAPAARQAPATDRPPAVKKDRLAWLKSFGLWLIGEDDKSKQQRAAPRKAPAAPKQKSATAPRKAPAPAAAADAGLDPVDKYLYQKAIITPQSRSTEILSGGEEGSSYLLNGALQGATENGPIIAKYAINEDGILMMPQLRLGVVSDGVGTGGGGRFATKAVLASCRATLQKVSAAHSLIYHVLVENAQSALKQAGLTKKEGISFGLLQRTAQRWEGLRIGDVRLYVLHKAAGHFKVKEMSVDQSIVEHKFGHLDERDKMQASLRNQIYNAIESDNQVIIDPFNKPAEDGDIGLILCDGIHECLSREEVEWFFDSYYDECERRGLNFTTALIHYAFLKHDGRANISSMFNGEMVELMANVADNGSAVLIKS